MAPNIQKDIAKAKKDVVLNVEGKNSSSQIKIE